MDPILPIGMSTSATSAAGNQERCLAADGQGNLAACEQTPAGAYLEPIVIIGRRIPPSMNVVSAGAMFSDRMQNGFFTKQVEAMVAKLKDPTVTSGEHIATAIEIQERVSTASVVNQIAHKLADGLQSIVTRSS